MIWLQISLVIKKPEPLVKRHSQFTIHNRQPNISQVFITKLYSAVSKNVRLNYIYCYFVMITPKENT